MDYSLKQVTTASKTAIRIFDILGSRDRYRAITDLRLLYYSMAAEEDVDPTEFVSTFKRLEKLGAGSLERGTDTTPDRFYWKYNLKEVVQASKTGQTLAMLIPLSKITKRKLDNPIAKAEKALEEEQLEALKNGRKQVVKSKTTNDAEDFVQKMRSLLEGMTPDQTTMMKKMFSNSPQTKPARSKAK